MAGTGVGGGDAVALSSRGLIGDTATAALVAADGTVDWYCPERFDAPAALFRLLDPGGGAVRVGPAGPPRRGTQAYDPATFVLRTRLFGSESEVEVADFMPWEGAEAGAPPGRIVRVVTALRGPVDVEVHVVPGTAFGPSRRVAAWSEGIAFDGLAVRAGCDMSGGRGVLRLDDGERAVVTVDRVADRHPPLPVAGALELLERTAAAWRASLDGWAHAGFHRGAVERSLLVGRALAFPTGAVVASPTASLPGRVGGERNFDSRFAWTRDACDALDVARAVGLWDEADRLAGWVARALGEPLPPRPAAVDGDAPPAEAELGLAGRRRSQPVRVGYDASGLNLDPCGDLAGALRPGGAGDGPGVDAPWEHWARLADWAADHWAEPDRGVWEVRGEPRQLTSSKLAAWSALARVAEAGRRRDPLDLAPLVWSQGADEIVSWLERHATTPLGTFRRDDAEDVPDAALLRLAWQGPWPADHPSVVRTVEWVLAELSSGSHVQRYPAGAPDGLPAGEGAFVVCGFWAVRALAALGRWEAAHERMEALVGLGGPLGLLPEQVDPPTGDFLGNFPAARSHLALAQADLALAAGPR